MVDEGVGGGASSLTRSTVAAWRRRHSSGVDRAVLAVAGEHFSSGKIPWRSLVCTPSVARSAGGGRGA